MRNIIALLLIVSSIGVFFGFIKPTYENIKVLQTEEVTYDDALAQIDIFKTTLAQHQKTLGSFNPEDLAKLEKFIPSSIDNVKLIIDINNIASNFGLGIKGITLDQPSASANASPVQTATSKQGYESVGISFNVTSTYENFLSFIGGLEKSLRLVDITSVSFTPSSDKGNIYNFHVTLKTYWLK
jgi:Tfp pilus assembly protein PilO